MGISTFQSASIKKPVSTGKKQYSKLTVLEKRSHVEAYLKSKQSQRAYCEAHGLNVSSFRNWRLRYGRQHTGKFRPVITAPKVERPHALRIEICKDACKIVLYDISNVDVVIEIMKGVLSCSSR